ncbi:MAG: tetratricopeptide repeat protein [bacterium]
MRILTLFTCIFFVAFSFGQNEELAKRYFDEGEFEKALNSYQRLYDSNKGNSNYFFKIVEIYQQLEQLDESERLLVDKIARNKSPHYLVELGYNYQLKNDSLYAKKYYQLARDAIEEKPIFAYNVAKSFENHSLIDRAAEVYERAMVLRPQSNYNMQLARIYGEQGKVGQMFSKYIDFIELNTTYINYAKRSFSEYISEDGLDENNILLRKALLKKSQQAPNILWNQLLSWLFVQQHDYKKAFAQEKAIHKRHQELQGVIDLSDMAIEENQYEIASEILDYIINNSYDAETILYAHQDLIELRILESGPKSYNEIKTSYNTLFDQYGRNETTLDLQLSEANFIAFYLNEPVAASKLLKESLNNNLSKYQQAKLKLKLGDILVFQEKFNEALIYFTQIQKSLKNSTLAQEARFKVAKTSYYKGDFEWAETQLKVLKSSTSQLIANDALDLKLLISDNKYDDSTQTALKLYAKADLYAYQNKSAEAINLLNKILEDHKTESIIDQALYTQAKLFEKLGQLDKAETNYKKIIEDFREDILADDAYFHLAELYANKLNRIEEAKPLYEKILFEYLDSIYYVEARKKYRRLRGDDIN